VTDPRTPVIVGVGQAEQRVDDDPTTAKEPIDLLAEAVLAAAADAATPSDRALLDALDTVAVVQMVSWHYPDPGSLLARRLRADRVRRTLTSTTGGNSPQLLLNALAADVVDGRSDIVLLGGAECVHTRWRARREPKVHLAWTEDDAPPCAEVLGDDRAGNSDYELAHGAAAPTQIYPLFETALRHAAGRDVDDHQRAVSELWATFAAVAAANPHAWSRTAYSPEEIRTVTPENRMISFPYPKRMCANIDVDQSAAVLLCSYAAAREARVPDDRLVFPLGGASAHEHYFFSERATLDTSPAMGLAARATLDAVGITVDDIARFDLYSCFPAAVELSMGELGLGGPAAGDRRELTVTGGLGFAGGPANDYPTHAIARMVDACRADPGSVGLVHALGWYSTKHSVGCFSTAPGTDGFARVDDVALQAAADALPRREPAGTYEGRAIVEATSVTFERDGAPAVGLVSLIAGDGGRALATAKDAGVLRGMTEHAWEGRTVDVTNDGAVNTVVTD
jgi:acetyl-CoA C-acetyltransferase